MCLLYIDFTILSISDRNNRKVLNNVTMDLLMTPYGFIYLTTNLINGKRYLGQTKRPDTFKYFGSGKAIRKALKKYGEQNFTREIIAFAFSKTDLDFLEEHFISEYNAVDSRNWYNISPAPNVTAGFTGKKHSLETKTKMRENMLTNHPNKGKQFGVETRQRMSKAKTGVSTATEYSREKSRQLGLSNKGLKRSQEVRDTMSKNRRGKSHGVVSTILTPTGVITTECLKDWCRDNNITYSSLRNTLTNNRPHKKTGFHLLSVSEKMG